MQSARPQERDAYSPPRSPQPPSPPPSLLPLLLPRSLIRPPPSPFRRGRSRKIISENFRFFKKCIFLLQIRYPQRISDL